MTETSRTTDTPIQASSHAEIHAFLVADVRGYTRYTLEHGDAAAARLSVRFAELAEQVVSPSGGQVLEVRGDEVLSVFTSARAALQAAAALQARLADATRDDLAPALVAGVGLDAGEAVPVGGGFRGAALNLAARLCALAGPGEVLASEAVIHLARRVEGLTYTEKGMVQLKGFADPVRVFHVAAEGDAHGPQVDEPRHLPVPIGGFLGALPSSPMVARGVEFERALEAVNDVASGAGRLLLLAGEPGVGKTRLAQEITVAVKHRHFLVACGRCYEPQAGVPLYPFLEALESAYAQAPTTVKAEAARRWPYLSRVLPQQLGSALPGSGDAPDEQQRLFRAVTDFLQTLALESPVAVMIDDLHWADAASLDLFAHLARHNRAQSVLLVGTYRDMEVARLHPLERTLRDLMREGLVERIDVRRLDRASTSLLLAQSLGEDGISGDLVDLIYRHTEGHPFFTQEVVRVLAERGEIARESGVWNRHGPTEIEVPESVRSAVGERLSRLGEGTQELLREASVFGTTFDFDHLLALSGHAESEVEESLDEAMAAGLVREAEGDSYAFNHALSQAALYAELPRRRRRRLHLAAADVLERSGGSTRRAAQLAWHLLEADDLERALPYVLTAGDEARSLFAHADAHRQYRTALDLARETGDRRRQAEAQEKLGRVLAVLGRYAESHAAFTDAEMLYEELSDLDGEYRVTGWLAQVDDRPEMLLPAVRRVEDLLARSEPMSASRDGAFLLVALAARYGDLGRYGDAIDMAHRAAAMAGEVGDNRLRAEAGFVRAWNTRQLGDLHEATRIFEEILPAVEESGQIDLVAQYLVSLSWCHVIFGELARGLEEERRALQLSRTLGDAALITISLWATCQFLFYAGDWEAARRHVEEVREVPGGLGTVAGEHARSWLGILALYRGDRDSGRSLLEASLQGLAPAQHLQFLRYTSLFLTDNEIFDGEAHAAIARLEPLLDRPGLVEIDVSLAILPTLAWAYLETGDMERAETTAQEAIRRTAEPGFRWALTYALRVGGMLHARMARYEEADAAFSEAATLAREMEYPFAEARALYHWALADMEGGKSEAARLKLQSALSIFRRLGARPYVDRIEEVFLKALGEPERDGSM